MGFDPKLKEAMAEIKAIIQKHDISGYISLVSPTHSEFMLEITPTWGAIKWEEDETGQKTKVRIRVKQAEVGKEKAEQMAQLTSHMIFQLRDLSAQGFAFTDAIVKQLEKHWEIDHKGFQDFTPHTEQ